MLEEARNFIICSIPVDSNRDDPISYHSAYFYFLKKKIEKEIEKAIFDYGILLARKSRKINLKCPCDKK